ncbi:NADP-dependent oxidoreductase [Nocardiopsis aegyptia]|nr:NADP-dependent oxidoreductase [Nocardiopsis aegyptia]
MRFHGFGTSEVLRYEDVDRPSPGPGQVLVRVAATSFNPVDDHIRAGALARMLPIDLPYVPGIDLSGTVAALGPRVGDVRVGDPVVAMLPLDSAGGAAEYALVPAESLAPAPRSIALADAAALPLTGLAAWQTAFELAELTSGQRVLVNGVGGAVGSLVVQLAARRPPPAGRWPTWPTCTRTPVPGGCPARRSSSPPDRPLAEPGPARRGRACPRPVSSQGRGTLL